MKKIINLILSIFIVCLIFKIFFIYKKNEYHLKYNYIELKIIINSSDSNLAIKTFSQFDEYFKDVYIDSTEIYQLQNSLKLYPEKYLDSYLDVISSYNLKSFLELFEDKFSGSLEFTKYEREIFKNFMAVILDYLIEVETNHRIGYDLLRSFNKNIISDKYADYTELNLVLKPISGFDENDIYNEIFEVINDVNNEMFNILQINFHTQDLFELSSHYFNLGESNIKIKLNEYHYGFSNTLDDLRETQYIINGNSMNSDEPMIYIESILDYISNDNSLKGDRFKKIKRYSMQDKGSNFKITLSNKEIISILDSYKLYIKQSDDNKIDDYSYNKNILQLLDQIIVELSKNNNIAKSVYMQDQFYKTKKHFSKYFSSLEPLTLEYLNSSIKKEFIHNDFFISKIFLRSSSDKYYDYVNAAFNEKTTIVFSSKFYYLLFIFTLLLLFINNFKFSLCYNKK